MRLDQREEIFGSPVEISSDLFPGPLDGDALAEKLADPGGER
jgi:hypothetical protein